MLCNTTKDTRAPAGRAWWWALGWCAAVGYQPSGQAADLARSLVAMRLAVGRAAVQAQVAAHHVGAGHVHVAMRAARHGLGLRWLGGGASWRGSGLAVPARAVPPQPVAKPQGHHQQQNFGQHHGN